jgi:hypothetical protein
MLGHAFASVDTVVFLVHRDNRRSQRAVEKLGAARVEDRVDGNGDVSFAYSLRRDRGRDDLAHRGPACAPERHLADVVPQREARLLVRRIPMSFVRAAGPTDRPQRERGGSRCIAAVCSGSRRPRPPNGRLCS